MLTTRFAVQIVTDKEGPMAKQIIMSDGYIRVQMAAAEEQSTGGIFVPKTAQKQSMRGVVLNVAENLADKIKVGDEVVYGHAYTQFQIEAGCLILKYPTEVLYVERDV